MGAKYHVGANGAGICNATKRACPLGEENHYDSQGEAEQAFKTSMEEQHGALATVSKATYDTYTPGPNLPDTNVGEASVFSPKFNLDTLAQARAAGPGGFVSEDGRYRTRAVKTGSPDSPGGESYSISMSLVDDGRGPTRSLVDYTVNGKGELAGTITFRPMPSTDHNVPLEAEGQVHQFTPAQLQDPSRIHAANPNRWAEQYLTNMDQRQASAEAEKAEQQQWLKEHPVRAKWARFKAYARVGFAYAKQAPADPRLLAAASNVGSQIGYAKMHGNLRNGNVFERAVYYGNRPRPQQATARQMMRYRASDAVATSDFNHNLRQQLEAVGRRGHR